MGFRRFLVSASLGLIAEKSDGWFVVPGRIDSMSYVLFGFFLLGVYLSNALI